jgi:hypothetical protein
VASVPPAIAGQHGDVHTFRICCRIARGFALDDEQALHVLAEWLAEGPDGFQAEDELDIVFGFGNPNPERQSQNRGGSHNWRLLEHAESVSNVLHQHRELLHGCCPHDVDKELEPEAQPRLFTSAIPVERCHFVFVLVRKFARVEPEQAAVDTFAAWQNMW